MDISFALQNSEVGPFKEGLDVTIKMTWNSNLQPVVEVSGTTFINEHIEIIQNHLDNFGIFEGLQFLMSTSDSRDVYTFTGYLDLTQMEIISPVQISAPVFYLNDLEKWNKKFESVSFGYLAQEKGLFGQADYTEVKTIVHKKFDALEVLFASYMLYMISKEVAEKIADDGAKVTDAIVSLTNPNPGFALKAISTIILKLAYYALMLIAILKLLKQIKDNLIPKQTKYKGIKLKTLLSKVCQYFNLTLVTDLTDLEKFIYLPSKTDNKVKTNRVDEGIPNVSDYGYQCYELVELCMKLCDARVDIQDGKFYFFNQYADHWIKQGQNNTMPSSIEYEKHSYNANEMDANTLINFQYDPSDQWTMPSEKQKDDYTKGTNYQVICDFDNGGDQIFKMNKGLLEINIPLALGKRRDKLSALDVAIKALLSPVDLIIRLFGGNTAAETINENRGALMISDPSFNIAKLLYIDQTGVIPSNHRDGLSARALYENYYRFRSFKTNAKRTQHLDFKEVTIPFDFRKFIGYLKSPRFVVEPDNSGQGGKNGKMKELIWTLSKDKALATFYIEEEYNKTKLYEKAIES